MDEHYKNIIEQIESKHADSIAFSKKHKSRENEDLFQYYEGANWAFKYVLDVIKNELSTD